MIGQRSEITIIIHDIHNKIAWMMFLLMSLCGTSCFRWHDSLNHLHVFSCDKNGLTLSSIAISAFLRSCRLQSPAPGKAFSDDCIVRGVLLCDPLSQKWPHCLSLASQITGSNAWLSDKKDMRYSLRPRQDRRHFQTHFKFQIYACWNRHL